MAKDDLVWEEVQPVNTTVNQVAPTPVVAPTPALAPAPAGEPVWEEVGASPAVPTQPPPLSPAPLQPTEMPTAEIQKLYSPQAEQAIQQKQELSRNQALAAAWGKPYVGEGGVVVPPMIQSDKVKEHEFLYGMAEIAKPVMNKVLDSIESIKYQKAYFDAMETGQAPPEPPKYKENDLGYGLITGATTPTQVWDKVKDMDKKKLAGEFFAPLAWKAYEEYKQNGFDASMEMIAAKFQNDPIGGFLDLMIMKDFLVKPGMWAARQAMSPISRWKNAADLKKAYSYLDDIEIEYMKILKEKGIEIDPIRRNYQQWWENVDLPFEQQEALRQSHKGYQKLAEDLGIAEKMGQKRASQEAPIILDKQPAPVEGKEVITAGSATEEQLARATEAVGGERGLVEHAPEIPIAKQSAEILDQFGNPATSGGLTPLADDLSELPLKAETQPVSKATQRPEITTPAEQEAMVSEAKSLGVDQNIQRVLGQTEKKVSNVDVAKVEESPEWQNIKRVLGQDKADTAVGYTGMNAQVSKAPEVVAKSTEEVEASLGIRGVNVKSDQVPELAAKATPEEISQLRASAEEGRQLESEFFARGDATPEEIQSFLNENQRRNMHREIVNEWEALQRGEMGTAQKVLNQMKNPPAPKQIANLKFVAGGVMGLGVDKDGYVTFDPEMALLGMVGGAVGLSAWRNRAGIVKEVRNLIADETGAIGKITKEGGITERLGGEGIGKGRYYRGGAEKTTNTLETFEKSLTDDVISKLDDGDETLKSAIDRGRNAKYLEPTLVEDKINLRYQRPNKEGFFGNAKMAFQNAVYQKGRNTWDLAGCGRAAFGRINNAVMKACYEDEGLAAACYAQVEKALRGGSVFEGRLKRPVQDKALRKQVMDYYIKAGGKEGVKVDEAVRLTQEAFPDLEIKWYEGIVDGKKKSALSMGKVTENPAGAKVSTNLQPADGQDIRIGVDTDGSAWTAREDVMDAILKANPRTVTIYSSGYHAPPKPHKLSERAIINVTVSGWHPAWETASRLRWAEEARNNGWNVILREVVADPAKFGEGIASKYNRFHEALMKTDFFIMQQGLHKGKVHSGKLWGMPGCCVGSKANPKTCEQCEVAEGLGQGFRDYWGVKGTKNELMPDIFPPETEAPLGSPFVYGNARKTLENKAAIRERTENAVQQAREKAKLEKKTSIFGLPDEHRWVTESKKKFGVTNDPNKAGYLSPDGTYIDYSGGKEFRARDHSDSVLAMTDDELKALGGERGVNISAKARNAYQHETGSVRTQIRDGNVGFSMSADKPLTPSQATQLEKAWEKGGYFSYDVIDKDGNVISYFNSETQNPNINFFQVRRKLAELQKPIEQAPKFTAEETAIANKTSRTGGAVGGNAVVPRVVRENVTKGESILDFGAGKDAVHANALKGEGYDVTAYDFGSNVKEGVHDPTALSRKYDTVYASNVLNTQSTPKMMNNTMNQIIGSMKEGGKAIFNFPKSPRKMEGLGDADFEQMLGTYFGKVEKVDKSNNVFKVSEPKIRNNKVIQAISDLIADERGAIGKIKDLSPDLIQKRAETYDLVKGLMDTARQRGQALGEYLESLNLGKGTIKKLTEYASKMDEVTQQVVLDAEKANIISAPKGKENFLNRFTRELKQEGAMVDKYTVGSMKPAQTATPRIISTVPEVKQDIATLTRGIRSPHNQFERAFGQFNTPSYDQQVATNNLFVNNSNSKSWWNDVKKIVPDDTEMIDAAMKKLVEDNKPLIDKYAEIQRQVDYTNSQIRLTKSNAIKTDLDVKRKALEAQMAELEPEIAKLYKSRHDTMLNLADKSAETRIYMYAEDTLPDNLVAKMSPEEIKAGDAIKAFMKEKGDAMRKVGLPVMEDSYMTHFMPDILAQGAKKNFLGKRKIPETLSFASRLPGSQTWYPSVHRTMDYYIPAVNRKIAYEGFAKKWGDALGKIPTESSLYPYLRQYMEDILMPKELTTFDKAMDGLRTFEHTRLIGMKPSVGFKHLLKLPQTMMKMGATTIPAVGDIAMVPIEKAMEKMGVQGNKARLNLYRTFVANKSLYKSISETPNMKEFLSDKIRMVLSQPVAAVEAFENGVSLFAGLRKAQSKGMSLDDAIAGVYQSILDANFRGTADLAPWLKGKGQTLTMFQMTPSKIWEFRMKVLKKALNNERDVFGTHYGTMLVRYLVALGAIEGTARQFDSSIMEQMMHLPMLAGDFFEKLGKGKYTSFKKGAESVSEALKSSVVFAPYIDLVANKMREKPFGKAVQEYLSYWGTATEALNIAGKKTPISKGKIPKKYKGSATRYLLKVPEHE